MFNSFQESINEIRFLEAKKEKIDNLLNAKNFTNIQIHFFADKEFQTIYQKDSEFNLETELRILLKDISDNIENQILNLKLEI
jgi:hypothetical protein